MATNINQNNIRSNDQDTNVDNIAKALKAREVPTNELKLSPKTARTDAYREPGDFFLKFEFLIFCIIFFLNHSSRYSALLDVVWAGQKKLST